MAVVAVLATGCGRAVDLVADDSQPEPTAETEQPCGESAAPQCGPPPDARRSSVAAFHAQTVEWSDCGEYECGSVEVPLDYSDPSGATVEIELKRAPAQSDHPTGTLFINPGGPGGSGRDYLEYFVPEQSDEVRDNYDIVGFDPRGVAGSDPLVCLDDAELDQLVGSDRREVIVRLRTFLDDLDQNPLDTGDPERPLTEALGFTGVVAPLYNQDYWPLLTEALTAAAQGDGSVLLRLGRCLSSPRKRPLSRQHDPGELRGQVPRRSSAPHPSTDSAVRAAIRAGVAGVRPDLRLVDARLLGVAYPAGAAAAGHRRRGRRADRRRRHHP